MWILYIWLWIISNVSLFGFRPLCMERVSDKRPASGRGPGSWFRSWIRKLPTYRTSRRSRRHRLDKGNGPDNLQRPGCPSRCPAKRSIWRYLTDSKKNRAGTWGMGPRTLLNMELLRANPNGYPVQMSKNPTIIWAGSVRTVSLHQSCDIGQPANIQKTSCCCHPSITKICFQKMSKPTVKAIAAAVCLFAG